MIALLILFALLGQGIPVPQAQSGVITGTLKGDNGKPAAGVRVAVLAVPEKAADISYATAMTSQAETDNDGHFRLENIPPGRYYITAGRVDYPTYFPGTQDITNGKIVTVKPGDRLDGADFTMNAITTRPESTFGGGSAITYVPVAAVTFKVSIEGGGSLPIFSPSGSFTSILLSGVSDKKELRVPLSDMGKGLSIQQAIGSAPSEFRVSVENLPKEFSLQSNRSGNSDLRSETLKIPPTSAATTVVNGSTLILGALSITSTISVAAATSPPIEINIVLKKTPHTPSNGVRVSGRISNIEPRSIYLSGKAGTMYSDGTFEFFDIPPGQHLISTPDNPASTRPQGANIVVGTQDLSGIQLVETPMLPLGVTKPSEPGPAGTHAPGIVSLASFKGRVVDEATREPIEDAVIFLSGHYGKSYHTDAEGKFEASPLLPGMYSMEIQTFAHATIRQTISVGETDVNMNFATMLLN